MVTPYETEDLLQQALVDFPEVLAGRVTAASNQRRVLLVKREKGVPVADGAANRFSIDHFFVDAFGVPVLVEVKRQTDTRIRREVVGQMLDYAANAVRYWPIAEIRDEFEEAHPGEDTDSLLADFSEVGDVEEFWKTVSSNLAEGRIRMLFVADGFPEELVRVIEFLNEQMSPAEVLGIEVRQYTDGERHVLVPRVIGATTAAEQAKKSSPSKRWTRDSMLDFTTEPGDEDVADLLDRLVDFADTVASDVRWGDAQTPGLSVWHRVGDTLRPTWFLQSRKRGVLEVGVYRSDLARNPGLEVVQPFFDRLTERIPEFAAAFEGSASFPKVSVVGLGTAGIGELIGTISEFEAEQVSHSD